MIWSMFFLIIALAASPTFAHPTGNMITVEDAVLWSYIDPIDDDQHHACVMIWQSGEEPEIYFKSEHPASDFMLFNNGDDIYIIERNFSQSNQQYQIRVLKTNIDSEPKVIWDWFDDNWRIGEGGFFMLDDDQIVFGSYPNIYHLKKGKLPIEYFEFDEPINRIRATNDQLLLLGNNDCWLVERNGIIKRHWKELLDDDVDNAPLSRNQIFDVDYHEGSLLLAYWGKRAFEIIREPGEREILFQEQAPHAPHWVAFRGKEKWLFSSELTFEGKAPRPKLIRFLSNGDQFRIW
ncbi:MAG: hypothetical protein JXQ90_19185 [Cyclobacteriaceae bacterium]